MGKRARMWVEREEEEGGRGGGEHEPQNIE